jgi:DNA invertase Pin-like site-specific DNA recombinase
LEAQQAAVLSYAAANGAEIIHAYEEIESGRKNARPQLEAALAMCRSQGAALIVAKLDRLTRDTRFLLTIRDETGDAGVVFCDLPQLPPGPIGKLFLTMLVAIAEFEAALISQRTITALAAAKARGKKLGNPRLQDGAKIATLARKRAARATAREIAPHIARARKAGCSTLAEIAEALSARGIKTPGGCSNWSAEQVRRIEKAAATLG